MGSGMQSGASDVDPHSMLLFWLLWRSEGVEWRSNPLKDRGGDGAQGCHGAVVSSRDGHCETGASSGERGHFHPQHAVHRCHCCALPASASWHLMTGDEVQKGLCRGESGDMLC